MKKILSSLALLAATSTQAFADQEDWYFDFGFGFSSPSYSSDLGKYFDNWASDYDSNRSKSMINLGFYWPVDDTSNIATGIVMRGFTDSFEFKTTSGSLSGTETRNASLNQSMMAFSIMQFYGEEIGDGLFWKAEIGTASSTLKIEDCEISDNCDGESYDDNESGIGLSCSGQLNLTHALIESGSEFDSHTAFSISGLW